MRELFLMRGLTAGSLLDFHTWRPTLDAGFQTLGDLAVWKRALEMPLAERRERHAPILEQLVENDVRKWAEDYLATLVEGAPTRRLLEGIRALFGVSSENGPLAFR
jgi:hypothetical protein